MRSARRAFGAALALGCLVAAAPAGAVEIHAHRGAPLENGKPVSPENSLTALRRAADRWRPEFLEVDVKRTADGVPVVIHDATLDRTTTCSGPVISMTAAQLRASCRLDRLGTDDEETPIASPTENVPTLADVLDFARAAKVRLHIEIKNPPTDPDFTDSPAVAVDPVMDLIAARGLLSDVAIQSYWPPDLARVEQLGSARGVNVRTGLITERDLNELAVIYGTVAGLESLLPQWPPRSGGGLVGLAHAAEKLVIPYTLDEAPVMTDAIAAGVDGFFTNDLAAADVAQPRPGAPFEPATSSSRPDVTLTLDYRRSRMWLRGRAVRCALGGAGVRLDGAGIDLVSRASYRLSRSGARSRSLKAGKSTPFRAGIRRSLLRPRRLHTVRATLLLKDGTSLRLARRIRACPR